MCTQLYQVQDTLGVRETRRRHRIFKIVIANTRSYYVAGRKVPRNIFGKFEFYSVFSQYMPVTAGAYKNGYPGTVLLQHVLQ